MPNLNVEVNVYGLPKIKRTVQMAAFVVDSFAAIPQVQLMHVIDAARDKFPETCAHLDAWLDTLDATLDEAQRIHDSNPLEKKHFNAEREIELQHVAALEAQLTILTEERDRYISAYTSIASELQKCKNESIPSVS